MLGKWEPTGPWELSAGPTFLPGKFQASERPRVKKLRVYFLALEERVPEVDL